MFTQRHRIHSALNKEAEGRALLTDWVRYAQGQGDQAALIQRILGSEGANLVVARRYDDLATLDKTRQANLADADWQTRLAKLSALIREPVRTTLEESLILPSSRRSGAGRLIQRVFSWPAFGKEQQMRSMLEEFVQNGQAAGQPQLGLWQRVFSEVGVQFISATTYADMAELAQVRQARATIDQTLVEAVSALSRAPVAVRLFEVLVPFPSSRLTLPV
jgi:hypothetical protein